MGRLGSRCFASTLVAFSMTACAQYREQVPRPVVSAVPVSSGPAMQSVGGRLLLTLDAVMEFPSGAPAFAYNGMIGVAPTLRMKQGDAILLTLHNRLPPTNFTPNAVNVHFHGLDVSPNTAQDEVVTTLANPGQTIHYALEIPATQQPGLYWYHTHSHGEAYWQATSGMSGAILVEPATHHASDFAAIPQNILILRDVQDHPNIIGVPWYARKGTVALEMAAARQHGITQYHPADPDDVDSGGPCSAERYMHVTIEGTHDGVLQSAPGQRQLLRVLNASGGRIFDLAVDGERLGLVGIDGYPLNAYPGTPSVVWVDHFVLPPGGRAEFLVTGQGKEAYLRSRCYNSGPVGDRDPALILARLVPVARLRTSAGSSVAAESTEPPSGDPITVQAPAVQRLVTFSEDAAGYYINHQSFDMKSMKPMFVVRSGTMERWVIENDTDEVHAFHIHQVHFVVDDVNGRPLTLRYWQDTAIVPPQRHIGRNTIPGRITALIDFRSPLIKGTFPFHCHMLDHEDGGMMALVKVI